MTKIVSPSGAAVSPLVVAAIVVVVVVMGGVVDGFVAGCVDASLLDSLGRVGWVAAVVGVTMTMKFSWLSVTLQTGAEMFWRMTHVLRPC